MPAPGPTDIKETPVRPPRHPFSGDADHPGAMPHSGHPMPDGTEPRDAHPRHGGHRRGRGPGGPGRPGGGPRGRRAGRGEIRAAILLLLAEEPMHGYQIITELAERTDGRWRPSPGAVYPAIAQLQDEGLVEVSDDGGRRLASLTDAGRAHVAEHGDELGNPWERVAGDPRSGRHRLRASLHALGGAVEQVVRAGTPAQADAAVEVLDRARREIYRLLAEDPGEVTPDR